MKALAPLAAACLLLAGCGGDRQEAAPPPRLPSRVADSLARQSRALAVSLEQHDACTAHNRLARLRTDAEQRGMPRLLRRRLVGAIADLGSRMPACVPVITPEPEERGNERARGKGKGHGKGKGKD